MTSAPQSPSAPDAATATPAAATSTPATSPAATPTAPDYRWSALTLPHVEAWTQLVNHLAQVDGTEEFYSTTDLTEELTSPNIDNGRDSWALWHGEQMVGFGQVWVSATPDAEGRVRCSLIGGIHTDHRRRGLGTQIMDRLEARAVESATARHPGTGFYFQASGGLRDSSAEAMLTSRGYQVVRYFEVLTRPLPGAALRSDDEPAPVPGVTVRTVRSGDEHAVLAAHRAAFTDHWGSTPVTDELWARRWSSSSNRHAVSTVAVDDQGRVLSYVLCGQWLERELFITTVGTRAEHRGRGLARASIAHTLRAAIDSGDFDVVELEVDSTNPTGANRLYERLGFAHKFTTTTLRKAPGRPA
ncbi:GNAT family N-acetyltransferase [Pseudactinotalea sp. Z1748]|uniref:GNAT family N-acetyltransferase n=1 Tax=Pseudactinotalea sp. Z1748 TaxID=3413027 RepID=UPI003C7C78BE